MFFDLKNCCEERSRVCVLKGSYGNECLLSPASSNLCVFVVKARLRSPSLLNIFNFSFVGEDPVAWTSLMQNQEPFSNCVSCPFPSLFPPGRKALAFYRGNNFAGLDVELSEIVAARKAKASTMTSLEGRQAGIMVRWFQFQLWYK